MKYSQFDPYQMKNHRIIWSCNFEPTNAKEAAKYSCTPIKGMLTINDDLETEQGDNPTHDGFYTTPRYFVPFKKNAKGCDLDDLAWSKAVNLRSRRYADTEDECIEIYNDLIMRNARHLIILAKEYTSNITGNVTDADKTFIKKLNNM